MSIELTRRLLIPTQAKSRPIRLRSGQALSRPPANALSLVRRYVLDSSGKSRMSLRINRLVADFNARRVLPKEIVVPPVRRWSDWPGSKSSTAVWTDVLKNLVGALSTERALVGTNACFERVRRKRSIAVFAGWSQFEHNMTPYQPRLPSNAKSLRVACLRWA